MATIVNNPPPQPERIVQVEKSDSTGWAIAVIILLIIIAGGAYYYFMQRSPTPPTTPAQSGSTNINVTLPSTGSGTTTSGY